jgi:hypothetical protein
MTKEIPMTNSETIIRAAETDLSFELRHSLVIRASSFVIRPLFPPKNHPRQNHER